jgi:hypothetical protein
MDVFGYHALSCLGVGNRLFSRHDSVLTALVDIAAASGLNPQKNAKVTCLGEGIRFGRQFLRPADMLFDDAGFTTCVDVNTNLYGRTLGACLLNQANLKNNKHLRPCADAGYDFLPFAVDVCGMVSQAAYQLLQLFARRGEAQSHRPYSELIATSRRRISCAVQLGVADQLLSYHVSFLSRLYRVGEAAAVCRLYRARDAAAASSSL